SEDERRVYEKAQHHNKLQKSGEEPGLHLKIKLSNNMIVGSNFEVFAILTNDCIDARTCKFRFLATAVSYNGRRGDNCGFASIQVEVLPGEERCLSLKLEYDSYGAAITSDRLIRLLTIAYDKRLDAFHKSEKTLVLDEPEIEIKLEGEATVNQSVTVQLTLLNPLPEPLQDCSFTIEGNNLTDGKPITAKIGAVGAAQEAKARIEFIPSSSGSNVLLVNFDSEKLRNIRGYIIVVVRGE
ncbi:protein-glutamine gamma-glutamyltransferase 2-like, partial [Brachyistius frenatus]|uniref:protein-glutamine gamma-glutamyltransferase 2-like n=1 Tax=Brachyistius frenatus TaxID=100188 RepID=UPI0037E848CA